MPEVDFPRLEPNHQFQVELRQRLEASKIRRVQELVENRVRTPCLRVASEKEVLAFCRFAQLCAGGESLAHFETVKLIYQTRPAKREARHAPFSDWSDFGEHGKHQASKNSNRLGKCSLFVAANFGDPAPIHRSSA